MKNKIINSSWSDTLTLLLVVATVILAIATWNMATATKEMSEFSFQQMQTSNKMINLTIEQMTPDVAIDIESNRMPMVIYTNKRREANYFEIYSNEIIRMQEDSFYQFDFDYVESYIPLNISFRNLEQKAIRLNAIDYATYCDTSENGKTSTLYTKDDGENIILPSEILEISGCIFPKINKENLDQMQKCSIKIFFLFEGFNIEKEYLLIYRNHTHTPKRSYC